MTIPKLIHQLWISPHTELLNPPHKVEGDISTWSIRHPDFEHKLWSLDAVFHLAMDLNLDGFSGNEIIDLIKVCRFPAMQADIGRLIILYLHGGFWVDLKLVPKSEFLSQLIDNDLVLIEHHRTTNFPDPGKFKLLNNSFFGCLRHSSFVRDCAILALQNIRERKEGVWHVTGPRIFMSIRERQIPHIFELPFPGVRLLRAIEFYEVLVGFGWGTYNAGGLHWSERTKTESTYLDG